MADTSQRDALEKDQRHYSAHGLNMAFTLSSLLLLGAVMLMLWKDYDREWRTHQKTFRAIELAQTRDALAAEDERLEGLADHAAISKRVAELEAAQANRQDELDALARDQDRANRKLSVAVQDLNFVKADASAKRYQVEATHSHHDDHAHVPDDNADVSLVLSDANDAAANEIDREEAHHQIATGQGHGDRAEIMDKIHGLEVFTLHFEETFIDLRKGPQEGQQKHEENQCYGKAKRRKEIEKFFEVIHVLPILCSSRRGRRGKRLHVAQLQRRVLSIVRIRCQQRR